MQTIVDTSNPAAETVGEEVENRPVAGRYRLVRPLGSGGMGNVYLADDLVLARRVALKTVRGELRGNDEVRRRIRRECRLQAAIGAHPNIVTLYDTVEEDDRIYLVMEYFAGDTLARHLAVRSVAGSSGLSLAETAEIILQILAALAAIHASDIVHRDIKTSNILLKRSDDGRYAVKLMDFGIARIESEEHEDDQLTRVGIRGPGTPAYMAPERIDPQAFGEIGPATDLYAVGIILYELLRGEPPFKGSTTDIFTAHLLHPPVLDGPGPEISAGLRPVVQKALAKRPEERYRDARAFAADLETRLGNWEAATTAPPGHLVPADATQLAPESMLPAAACEATILVPAVDQQSGRPILPRTWVYLLFAAACLLVLYFGLRNHPAPVTGPSVSAPPALTAGGQGAVEPQPPAAAREDNRQASALETVETAREGMAEGGVAPGRVEGMSREASGWQVIESNSRKVD